MLHCGTPALVRLADSPAPRRDGRPRALILAPTRELASKIEASIAPLVKGSFALESGPDKAGSRRFGTGRRPYLPPSERIQRRSGRVCCNVCAYEAGKSTRLPRHSSRTFS
jgi:hypothetical protein